MTFSELSNYSNGYRIRLRLYQTDTSVYFHVVEKLVWNYANGGIWTTTNGEGEHVLSMGGSGTSGALVLQATNGQRFIVVLGVHNNSRWCDIVTALKPDETGLTIISNYYNGGGRAFMREKVAVKHSVRYDGNGRQITVEYKNPDGHELEAALVIG